MNFTRRSIALGLVAGLAACSSPTADDNAARRARLDAAGDAALVELYKKEPYARQLAGRAKGLLIIPKMVQGGLIVTGESGDGVMRVGGQTVDYYDSTSVGVGLAIGVQSYSKVLMFLTDEGLRKFRSTEGFEAGVDGSIAVLERGAGGSVDTNNIKESIVAFVYSSEGLMANVSLAGSKYTRLNLR